MKRANQALIMVFGLLWLGACGATIQEAEAGSPRCTPAVRGVKWRHHVHGGRVASKLGSPRHVVLDALASADQPVEVRGKFAYGKASKDVEDEMVELWQELPAAPGQAPCGWRALGRQITDDDGRVSFTVPAESFAGPGPHKVRMYLLGDRTYAQGRIWVLAPGRAAVLFDIDGTLTTDDGQLFEDLLGGTAEMWPSADEVARHWVEQGFLPVYITGRPYFLRNNTLAWLTQHRFPLGPVFGVDSSTDFLPGESHVGEFKQKLLSKLVGEVKVRFHRAYGNAATDVCAYARVGIPPEQTYIAGKPRPGCDAFAAPHFLPSYVEHLRELQQAKAPAARGAAPAPAPR